MKRTVISFFLLLLFVHFADAQPTAMQKKILRSKEDSLQYLAKNLIMDSTTAGRMRKDSLFIRTLVRSLQTPNSFYYPFDSVKGISKLYAPDSSFRIFTWNLSYDDFYSRQRGAIQLRTSDGSLRLIPLRDFSEFTTKPHDSLRNKDNWIGAVYYNIIKTEYNGKPYYTLFGIEELIRSKIKWVDVLSFDERNMPVFGGVFSFEKDSVKKPSVARYSIEYKKEASALLNYVDEQGMILVDHLISESDEPDQKHTFVPDGDSEGFKWEKGKWVHIDKVFDYKVDMKGVDPYMGNPPMGDPLLDINGKKNEEKLKEKSDSNKTKKKKD